MFLATPSLNQAPLLRQCLANVQRLGPGVRHHVADALSVDGTEALLLDAKARRGDRFSFARARDGGMYEALGVAFSSTDEDVLGWLNCDDLLFPWTASLVEDTFRAHPDVDVVYGDALELRGDRWALTVHPPPSLLRALYEGGAALAQPAVFFRRRVFERMGGFDHAFRLLADGDFFLRALSSGARFHKTWELLAVQRMVEGQLMEKHAARALDEWAMLRERHHLSTEKPRLPALLHRAGIVGMLAPVATAWKRARAAEALSPSSWSDVAKVLAGSSSGRTYLRPGAGLALLLPEAGA